MATSVNNQQKNIKYSNMQEEERALLREGVRELLKCLEPLVRMTGSTANVQGMLAYMAEVDESFDELKMVSWVQSELRKAVGPLLVAADLGVEEQQARPLLEKVMMSGQLKECISKMRAVLASVGGEMQDNFDFGTILSTDPPSAGSTRKPLFLRTHSENESLMSSSTAWHQSSFLESQDYVRLGEKLNRFSHMEVRIEALNMLLKSQLSEAVVSGAWLTIKEGLQAALLDPNATLSAISMKIHAKLLNSATAFAAKEAYTNLTSAVTGLYQDKTRMHAIPTLALGIKKKTHLTLIQLLKMLVDANCYLPGYWIRYPEKYVEDIIGGMIGLLATKGLNKKIAYPMHLLALVDPNAKWLKVWTHGHFGRNMVLRKLQASDSALVKQLVSNVLVTLENKTVEEWTLLRSSFRNSAKWKGSISESLLSYGLFCECLSITTLLLQYQQAFQFFSAAGPQQYINSLVMFVATKQNISAKGPASLITKGLLDAAAASHTLRNLLASSQKVIQTLLLPLHLWTERSNGRINDGDFTMPLTMLSNSCQILLHILRTPGAVSLGVQPVVVDDNQEEEDEVIDVVDAIMPFCTLVLQKHRDLEEPFLHCVLDLCIAIGSNYVGVIHPNFSKLTVALLEVLTELADDASTPTNSVLNLQMCEQQQSLTDHVKDTLRSFLVTPRGVFSVTANARQQDNLEMVVTPTTQNLPLVALTMLGAKLLCSEQLTDHQLSEDMVEDNADWRSSLNDCDRTEVASRHFSQLLTSIDFMREVMWEDRESKEGSMLKRLLLLQNCEDEEELLALRLIQCALSNLDNYIFLEHKYRISHLLESKLAGEETEVITMKTRHLKLILASTRRLGNATMKFDDMAKKGSNRPTKATTSQLIALLSEGQNISSHNRRQWLGALRRQYGLTISSSTFSMEAKVMSDLLEQVVMQMRANETDAIKKPDYAKDETVVSHEGTNMAVGLLSKYAYKLELFPTATEAESLFKDIVMHTQQLLKPSPYYFDWFAAVTLMLMQGDLDRSKTLLNELSSLSSVSPFIWPSRGRAAVGNGKEKHMLLISCVGHWIELLLSRESPIVFAALKGEEVSVAAICYQWLNECFLNTLPWSEICNYVGIVVVFGADFVVYFCVTLLNHLQDTILSAIKAQDGSLVEMLRSPPLEAFLSGEHLPLMAQYSEKYGGKITADFHMTLKMLNAAQAE